jgi:broad specificity phosphatase PhoE
MPTRILLVRHAESTHPHVFNGGETDVPLSSRGERQARAIAPILASFDPVAVVSSAMQRAVQTAQPIAEACGVTLRIEADLHERFVGELCGKSHDEARPVWSETVRRWKAGDTGYAPPGAESFLDVQRRAVPVVERLAAEFADQTIIVVAHGHTIRVLLLSLLPGRSAAGWDGVGSVGNAGITELLWAEQGWQLRRFNEIPAAVEAASGAE